MMLLHRHTPELGLPVPALGSERSPDMSLHLPAGKLAAMPTLDLIYQESQYPRLAFMLSVPGCFDALAIRVSAVVSIFDVASTMS